VIYRFENVLIAGRRVDGSADGRTEDEALRAFAATVARDLRVDVAMAIAQARADKRKRVFLTPEPLAKPTEPLRGRTQFLSMLDDSPYVEWPAMLR